MGVSSSYWPPDYTVFSDHCYAWDRLQPLFILCCRPCRHFSRWLCQNVFCKDVFFFFKISTHYSIIPTVVGWREAAGCLLHLPRDVRQVLLYTTAPEWSSSLLHGSEQVGRGWGGTSGGTWQGEVTLKGFTLNYSVKVLCSFFVALSRSISFIMKSFMELSKRDHVKWIQEYLSFIPDASSLLVASLTAGGTKYFKDNSLDPSQIFPVWIFLNCLLFWVFHI